METSDKILLALLLLALAALPVAILLYLRTAYRDGGWRQVRVAAVLAAVTFFGWVAAKYWFDWEFNNFWRVLEHPFALGSIVFVLLMWLGHWVLTVQNEDTNDHD
jgi:membrane protease YdiL (CAAX protease family)